MWYHLKDRIAIYLNKNKMIWNYPNQRKKEREVYKKGTEANPHHSKNSNSKEHKQMKIHSNLKEQTLMDHWRRIFLGGAIIMNPINGDQYKIIMLITIMLILTSNKI